MPKNLIREDKAMFVWYSKEKAGLKMIYDENNALPYDELFAISNFLKCQSMHVFT